MTSRDEPPNKLLLKAEWIWRGSGDALRDHAIVVEDDRVIAVGPAHAARAAHPDAELIDFGAAIILPGLINAHAHLELSACTPGQRPGSFGEWILSLPRRMGRETAANPDELFAGSTRAGIEQCLRFGVTCVGDISQQMHVTRPILRDSPLGAVSFGEVLGLARRRDRFEELLPRAIDESHASDRLQIGLTPHAPYTVEPRDIEHCAAIARQRSLPLAIHLAETREEFEFIRSHAGAFKEIWELLGYWQDFSGAFEGSPVAFAKSLGLLDQPTLLAHVNYCDDADLALFAGGRASVVYCPRTHAYFGHPPHRWREMLSRGINIAVGTDSCASSPDLNLLDDLRLLHEIAPEHPVESLWQMATTSAAKAIQWKGELNDLADLVVFDVSTDDPLREILETPDRLPREVWIGGEKIT